MSRQSRIIEPAAEELAEAVMWYERQQEGVGAALLEAIDRTIVLIEIHPEIGSIVLADGRTRQVIVRRFPYRVVYYLSQDEIVVIAIAHTKRRPGYWRERV